MYAEVNGSTLVKWPYDYDTLCKENPYTSFPTNTSLLDLYKGTDSNKAGNSLVFVTVAAEPSFDPKSQFIIQNPQPNLENSKWILGWTVQTMSADQQTAATNSKAANMRADRNGRLAASDFTQLTDAPVDKTAWAQYRQQLRDLTKQTGFPWTVTWPTAPQ